MKNINIIEYLQNIVDTNTKHYRSDFNNDIKIIRDAAMNGDESERWLLFMARPYGTWCINERKAFMQGTTAHTLWTYYQSEPEGIMAYTVHITAIKDNVVYGDIYPLNYIKHSQYVSQAAVKCDSQIVYYTYGSIKISADTPKYSIPGIDSRDFIRIELTPNNPEELSAILYNEHKTLKQMGGIRT